MPPSLNGYPIQEILFVELGLLVLQNTPKPLEPQKA